LIYSLVWNDKNLEHIALHNINPEEIGDVCMSAPLILKAPSKGQNPVYYVLGQTQNGRYLFSVIIYFGKSKGYVVTSRDMTDKEKRRFAKWKKR